MGRGGSRYGAGRPGWRRKCEQSLALDIRQLQQKGRLSPGESFSWRWTTNDGEDAGSIVIHVQHERVTLNYQWTPYDHDPRSINCLLRIDRTPCNFGGHRPWFVCPQCRKRCAVVYFGRRNGHYACRKCLNLAYFSETEDAMDRLWRKHRKLEKRLGTEGKPKGMHWRTWERIHERIAEVEEKKDRLFMIRAAHLLGMLDNVSDKLCA